MNCERLRDVHVTTNERTMKTMEGKTGRGQQDSRLRNYGGTCDRCEVDSYWSRHTTVTKVALNVSKYDPHKLVYMFLTLSSSINYSIIIICNVKPLITPSLTSSYLYTIFISFNIELNISLFVNYLYFK